MAESYVTENYITPFLDILADHKVCDVYPAFDSRLTRVNKAFVKIFRKLN